MKQVEQNCLNQFLIQSESQFLFTDIQYSVLSFILYYITYSDQNYIEGRLWPVCDAVTGTNLIGLNGWVRTVTKSLTLASINIILIQLSHETTQHTARDDLIGDPGHTYSNYYREEMLMLSSLP